MNLIRALAQLLASLPLNHPVTSNGVTKTVQQLVDELDAKGDSTDIADFLRESGYEGVSGDNMNCPVALYLSRNLGTGVKVDEVNITVGDTKIPTPSNVSEFISEFDGGDFPDLDTSDNYDDVGFLDEDEDEDEDED